jgi:SAM-dependent methyltransferase
MPTSEHQQIPRVCDVLVAEKPATVLDVGAGYGKYGLLAREFGGATRVDAIDVNPPRFQVYDHVYLGDLREIDTLLPKDAPFYDLALFIDVIEHLEKADAWAFLDRLLKHARRVLITTPWGFRPQVIEGQPWETHRSGWLPWEFDRRHRVIRWSLFPGHYTRFLRRPRLYQVMVLIEPRPKPARLGKAGSPR